MPASRPPELTVLVFKDNRSTRSFQVPLGWITRFGFALGALAATALFSSFFAVKFYQTARRTDPSRVLDLEQRLGELTDANQRLESKLVGARAPAPPAIVTVAGPPVTAAPIPTVTVTVTPAAQAPAPATGAPAAPSAPAPAVFGALPPHTEDLTAGVSKLPVTISPARISWSGSGHTLKVNFNIEYVGADHGSQQGRILVLARGPSSLLAYPDGSLNRAGNEALISPHLGEFFSVSRFREVKAEFTNLHGPCLDVEVLILNLDGHILSYQKFQAPPPPASESRARARTEPAVPAAAKSAVPTKPDAAPPSDIIEPGVDQ